jgi:hypothetical protein
MRDSTSASHACGIHIIQIAGHDDAVHCSGALWLTLAELLDKPGPVLEASCQALIANANFGLKRRVFEPRKVSRSLDFIRIANSLPS